MSDQPVAVRTFSVADQDAFARISGDRNPIHMDVQACRRTQAGAPVVHGLHGVLWALDRLCADGVPVAALASVKVQFPKFIYLDRNVTLRVTRRSEQAIKVELATDGMVATVLDLRFGSQLHSEAERFEGLALRALDDAPRSLAFSDLEGLSGCLEPSGADELTLCFPSLCAALGQERAESLALLSTLVGMVCPGLHSIFSGFNVSITDDSSSPGLWWRTARTDERFRVVWMNVWGGGIAGEVEAFVRAEPIEPPRMNDLATRVSADEFAPRTALVIGGSRGLGAATAKLLAAGGAKVFVTYATGKVEADALVEQICAARGCDRALALQCDVTGDFESQLGSLPRELTHLYYFATPRIFFPSAVAYSRSRFDQFLSVYADGFSKAAHWLAAHSMSKPISILYPSTVFIDNRPKGMTEYAMAKAAGEVLAKDLATALRVSITTPRIPRVLTDQTATVLPVNSADAVDVMLPLLRAEPQE